MLRISKEEVEKFLAETKFDVQPGQQKVSFPIIERIHRRLQEGKTFSPIQVSGGIIVDGHHRFICLSLLGQYPEFIKGGQNVTTIEYFWENVVIEESDYDSPEKIAEYRERYDT